MCSRTLPGIQTTSAILLSKNSVIISQSYTPRGDGDNVQLLAANSCAFLERLVLFEFVAWPLFEGNVLTQIRQCEHVSWCLAGGGGGGGGLCYSKNTVTVLSVWGT